MPDSFETIRKAFSNNKIAGSWLVIGGHEYEKKSFIQNTCSLLLKEQINEINAFHPDIKWLECGLTEESKKEIQKRILAGKSTEDLSELSYKREITVDDIRSGIQFLSLKSSPDRWRILVIYPADKMNENAANALLKVLEEPSDRSVIFLLCQNLGKLLPTIRSRCRKIVLHPLSDTELAQKIRAIYPAVTDIDTVVRLSDGSLGLAREICDYDGLGIYQRMLSLLVPTDQLSVEAVKSFAADITDSPIAFNLFRKFLSDWLVDRAKNNALTAPFLAEDYIDLYQEITNLFRDIDRIYLDPKQVVQTAIFKIAEGLK